ncbi:potassium transporter [bacterium]|jgi:trk system potassium uptake protein|nr:potassium transporter [bacterium]
MKQFRNSVATSRFSALSRRVPIAVRLVLGLVLLVLVGTTLLSMPMSDIGGAVSVQEALFTSVSALAVTGLSTITPSTDLSPAGKVILMLLIQVGGVGYMVLAILVFRLLGRSISLTDRMALQDSLGLINLGGIVQLSIRVFMTVLVIEFIGAVLLFFLWSNSGPLVGKPPGYIAFFAMFHAVSSFCNAGFDIFNGKYVFPTDTGTLAILSSLIYVGGLGIPVLFDAITTRNIRKFSLHSKLTLLVATGLVFWGAFAIFVSESVPGGMLDGLSFWRAFELSLAQSVSCRTAGFAFMGSLGELQSSSVMVMVTLMFVGCGPASMGGGITTGTFVCLVLALVSYVKRRDTPVVWGKAIPGEMVRKAAAVLTVGLFVVLTATWLILITHPGWSLEEAVFEVVSAFATCGLTLDRTLDLSIFGQYVIMFMMFWGRLGALTILFAFTRPSGPKRLRYPEEKILIG